MNPIVLVGIGIGIGMVLAVIVGALAPDTTVGNVTASANRKTTVTIAVVLLLVVGIMAWQQSVITSQGAEIKAAIEMFEIQSDGSSVAPER